VTILNRFYSSSGPEVELDTLEIRTESAVWRLVKGYEGIEARTEDDELVTFECAGIDVAMPARNADGTQDLAFAISNIDGVASTELRRAIRAGEKMHVVYRAYLYPDLSAPAKPPVKMEIKGGSWTRRVANLTAGYMNLLDTAWPRERYTLTRAPGLRYL